MAHDGHLGCLGLPPRDSPLARKELSDLLWTCHQLLGEQHPLTIDTPQLLSHLARRAGCAAVCHRTAIAGTRPLGNDRILHQAATSASSR